MPHRPWRVGKGIASLNKMRLGPFKRTLESSRALNRRELYSYPDDSPAKFQIFSLPHPESERVSRLVNLTFFFVKIFKFGEKKRKTKGERLGRRKGGYLILID